MKMRYFMLAAFVLLSAVTFAQKKSGKKGDPKAETSNLVPNPSFEEGNTKSLKNYGQLEELCTPWTTPNATSADYYSAASKSTKSSAPTNDYGKQDPADGESFAGFCAFTKDPKKFRTYIMVELSKKLEKDKTYCVKFKVSLADKSKMAVNNVGAFLSDKGITRNEDLALNFTPQVLEKNNKIINMANGWETICGTVIGTGKEAYLIIGGFGDEVRMKIEKIKKPDGTPPYNGAYYFIDDIEITEVEAPSQCNCSKADSYDPDYIYSKATAKSPGAKPEQLIAATTIYFAHLSKEISPDLFSKDMDEVLAIMKSNPKLNIELEGHSDGDEMSEAKINPSFSGMALGRAEAVKAFLVEKGIGENRITVTSKDNTAPANAQSNETAKAQNRRVQFIIK
jgi:outer membrane protein OmpA-like peptidoglycan-associated protein